MRQRARLRTYWAIAAISFRNTREYTINFLIHFVNFPVELVALFFIYSIVYWQSWLLNGTVVIGGFSLFQLVSYLFVSIMLQKVLPPGSLSRQIERDIDDGILVTYLGKPVDYMGHTFFVDLPRGLLFLCFGGVTYLVGIFLLGLPVPLLVNVALFLPLMLVAHAITFLLYFTLALATFWVGRQWWLRQLVALATLIAGGGLIPLTFFPPIAQLVLSLLPFQYSYFIPVVILQGFYTPDQLIPVFLLGATWLAILWVLSRVVWRRGRNRYEGAGG